MVKAFFVPHVSQTGLVKSEKLHVFFTGGFIVGETVFISVCVQATDKGPADEELKRQQSDLRVSWSQDWQLSPNCW